MSIEIQTAIIAAVVALLTAGISGYLTWSQIRRERIKWLTDLKNEYAIEIYKARLATYPKMQEIIGQLSSQAKTQLTPERANEIALEINNWVYSNGGLVAETNTRGAILGLRDACMSWHTGNQPKEIKEWRNATLFLLRRDLDVLGLEAPDALEDRSSLLEKIKGEITYLEKSQNM